MTSFKLFVTALTLGILSVGCSMDFVPVHYSRVNALKISHETIQRGPSAPGAFLRAWNFSSSASGFLADPTRVEFGKEGALLKNPEKVRDAVIETETGFPYAALDSFSVTGSGNLRFQLSHNGSKWYWHNGTAWVEAERSSRETNSSAEVNAHISTFHSEVGVGVVQLKAFLLGAPQGAGTTEIKTVSIQGISPRLDGWH